MNKILQLGKMKGYQSEIFEARSHTRELIGLSHILTHYQCKKYLLSAQRKDHRPQEHDFFFILNKHFSKDLGLAKDAATFVLTLVNS